MANTTSPSFSDSDSSFRVKHLACALTSQISMSLADCETECRKNCSCTAYSNVDIRQGGTGCMLWFGDLIDMRNYPDNGLPLYVRSSSQSGYDQFSSSDINLKFIIICFFSLWLF